MTKTIQSTDLTAIDLDGYSGINGVTVTATGGRYALSFDKGATWKSRVINSYTQSTTPVTTGITATDDGHRSGGDAINMLLVVGNNYDTGWAPASAIYTLASAKILTSYDIATTSAPYGPKTWHVSASNDGTNWNLLDTRTAVVAQSPAYTTFTFSNTKAYLKYRLTVDAPLSPSGITLVSKWWLYESAPVYVWETILASEIQTKGMTPALVPTDFTPVFQRTQLDFLISLEDTESITGLTVFLPANQAPKATNIVLNPATVHAGDAILSADLLDQEEQDSDYRILIDGDIIRDWTPFGYSASIAETININNLTMGSHVAHIQTRDSMAKQADYTINFTRVNGTPTASVVWDSKHISAILGDPDKDKIKYQLTINGVIKIAWTEWVDAGFNFVYYFKRGELPVDQDSTLKIEYMDAIGASGVWTGVVAGTYFNLMFKDTLGNYYSNDYGTTLKILDLGTLIAGSATGYAEIMVKNETGFPVQNIQVYAENPYTGVNILLSYSGTPFVPVNPWVIPSVVADGDEVPLYIQCTADESAKHGGDFKLHIVGDLILPEIP